MLDFPPGLAAQPPDCKKTPRSRLVTEIARKASTPVQFRSTTRPPYITKLSHIQAPSLTSFKRLQLDIIAAKRQDHLWVYRQTYITHNKPIEFIVNKLQ